MPETPESSVLFADRFHLLGSVREGPLCTELPARDTRTGAQVLLWLPHERLLPDAAARTRFVQAARGLMADGPAGILPIIDAADDERTYVAVAAAKRPALPLAGLVNEPHALPGAARALAKVIAPLFDGVREHGLWHGLFGARDLWVRDGRMFLGGVALWTALDRDATLEVLAFDPLISPEALADQPVGPASDVYALAALCLRLCTAGTGGLEGLLTTHRALHDALAWGLARMPADRPPSCAALHRAIERAVSPRFLAQGTVPPARARAELPGVAPIAPIAPSMAPSAAVATLPTAVSPPPTPAPRRQPPPPPPRRA